MQPVAHAASCHAPALHVRSLVASTHSLAPCLHGPKATQRAPLACQVGEEQHVVCEPLAFDYLGSVGAKFQMVALIKGALLEGASAEATGRRSSGVVTVQRCSPQASVDPPSCVVTR